MKENADLKALEPLSFPGRPGLDSCSAVVAGNSWAEASKASSTRISAYGLFGTNADRLLRRWTCRAAEMHTYSNAKANEAERRAFEPEFTQCKQCSAAKQAAPTSLNNANRCKPRPFKTVGLCRRKSSAGRWAGMVACADIRFQSQAMRRSP